MMTDIPKLVLNYVENFYNCSVIMVSFQGQRSGEKVLFTKMCFDHKENHTVSFITSIMQDVKLYCRHLLPQLTPASDLWSHIECDTEVPQAPGHWVREASPPVQANPDTTTPPTPWP